MVSSRARRATAIVLLAITAIAAEAPGPTEPVDPKQSARPIEAEGSTDSVTTEERRPRPLASWLDNPRSLTTRGLTQIGRSPEVAYRSFQRALELAPDDPLLQFNAGTAALLAGDPRHIRLLEAAASTAPPQLAARAEYNLGNAHLQAGNSSAAVEAYKRALRGHHSFEDAKVNLEIALAQLSQQTASPESPQQVPDPSTLR